jgi:2-polyprenyl-3-methyl-5-hydroxy-6-metoxy-1,4-benzoquinol methylase
MPKKIRFESAVHQLFAATARIRTRMAVHSPDTALRLEKWLSELNVAYDGVSMHVSWGVPRPGGIAIPLDGVRFHVRGDADDSGSGSGVSTEVQQAPPVSDPVETANAELFDRHAASLIIEAGLFSSDELLRFLGPARLGNDMERSRKQAEADFHDDWASAVDVSQCNVRAMNEACTAPEMRHIRHVLGNITNKRILDVGCGLGEASVYFALEGAEVTATDISPGMLETVRRLAIANAVTVKTVLTASEDLSLDSDTPFDVIHAGNVLHHVDIETTLDRLLPLLHPDGLFVSWDPLAYNPLINVYRMLATSVRTPDEHPFRTADISLVQQRFEESETRYFWLCSLLVFVLMVVFQFRNPNKERFWKKVVEESEGWAWLYKPLERIDGVLLYCLPFLRPLCWNVVIIGRRPRRPATSVPRGCSQPGR